ncbi:MAG: four helix bundle protein [bacterium]
MTYLVYRDTYKLVLKIFTMTRSFSREYKYTLGQDMQRDASQLVRNIYRANKVTQKQAYLENIYCGSDSSHAL